MIRSTFAGFTTAQLGMAASQRSLDVAGQNIANINTIGYTKQRLDVASLNLQKGSMYNSKSSIKVGFGVEMTGISQLRDPFLDAQYRSQISKLGTSDAHAAGFERLTPIFDEAVMDGVREAFISLTSSLSTLSTQVGNKENDALVRSKMQTILNLFHDNAVRLQDVRDDVQQGFATTDLGDLNQILENIAELNTSIKNSQILGNPALELKDQRNNLLDELGSYLPITVKYEDKIIGPGQTVEVLNVNFTDTNGVKHSLIADDRFSKFKADVSGEPVTLSLIDADGNTINVTDTIGSGTLKGTLDMINKSGDF
ncbi:MAG: flagellar basal body protein, partial [Lachnospiraceae bacterium]|nr:flagellar basal body protein [Lachnospiraceae bacterium]